MTQKSRRCDIEEPRCIPDSSAQCPPPASPLWSGRWPRWSIFSIFTTFTFPTHLKQSSLSDSCVCSARDDPSVWRIPKPPDVPFQAAHPWSLGRRSNRPSGKGFAGEQYFHNANQPNPGSLAITKNPGRLAIPPHPGPPSLASPTASTAGRSPLASPGDNGILILLKHYILKVRGAPPRPDT